MFSRILGPYTGNEPAFVSETIRSLLKGQYGIDVVNAPPLHSTSNGQVERFHSTLLEITRCLKLQRKIDDVVQLFLQATIEYNRTFHLVTKRKPIEVVYASADLAPDIVGKLTKAQQEQLSRNNPARQNRVFEVGDTVLVKSNRRLGDKLTPYFYT